MTVAHRTPDYTRTSPSARRTGYVISITVNAGLLFVVHNILAWDILSFLTDEWEEVVPIISLSIVAGIVVNVVYLFYDEPWFKSLTQIVVLVIGLAAAIQVFRVFPFDFSAYDFNWTLVTKAVLIVGVVGSAVGIIVEATRTIRALVHIGS